LSVAGGREIHDGNGGASAVVVPPGNMMVRRRRVGGAAGGVLLRDRLKLRLRGYRFLASGGLSAEGLVDGTLFSDEVGVRRGHRHHGLLACAFAVELALRQLVMLQRPLVPRQRRRRRLRLCHGGAVVRLSLLRSETCVHRSRGAVVVGARLHDVVIGDLGRAAGKPALIRQARRLSQATARAATACFMSGDKLSHNAFTLAVMADVGCGAKEEEVARVLLWR
jgi:hypothetical protein